MHKKFKYLFSIVFAGLVLSFISGACNKKQDEKQQTIKAKQGPVEALHEVKMPAEVFAWAVAGTPRNLLQNIESLASKAGPIPSGSMGQSINDYLVKMGLKDTSVIDFSAPAGILILNTMKYPIPFLVALSTKGEKAVLASLKPAWKHKGEKKGIHEFSREVVDPYAVFKGGKDSPVKKTKQSMYIKFEGATALIALAPSVIQDAGNALIERLKDAPSDGMNAALHVDNMRSAFSVQLSMMPQLARQQIDKMVNDLPPQLALTPKATRWILGWLSDKGFAFIQQTKEITLAVGVSPTEAVIHTGIVAEAGSFFAKFLEKQKHADLKLANGLPNDAFLAMGMNLQWKFLKKDILDFTKEAFENFTDEKISEETSKLLDEWFDTAGNEFCLVENLSKEGAFEIVELIQVTNEKNAKDLLQRMMAFMGKIYSSKSGIMGIKASVEGPKTIKKYEGVEIQETTVNMDLTSLTPVQADAIKAVYKDGKMRFYTAVFNRTIALAMGNNGKKNIEGAMDRLLKNSDGFTKSAAYKSAAGKLGYDTGGFVYLSLSNMIYATAKQIGGQMQHKIPEAKSGMFMKFSVDGRTMFSSMRLPAQHLEELSKAIQSLAQISNAPAPNAPAPASK